MENGYHMYTFSGSPLSENPTEKFKQLLWRPRPPTLLSKEEQRNIRRNLREYSRDFDEEDKYAVDIANTAIVEQRRRLLEEWDAWVRREKEEVKEEREELGIPDPMEQLALQRRRSGASEEEHVVEELVEDVIEESEEFA
jgi:translation initiation factor 3 subunit B